MRSRTLWWSAVILILLVALVLRVQKLTRISLTNDEVAEVTWSGMPFGDMLDRVAIDMVHPPLDYIVQHAIGTLDPPEWVRRLVPVLFGVATVGLTIALGTMWCGELAGLLAGFFLAIAPLHVRFSQEIRPYSMALFFTVASLVALEVYARRKTITWAALWFLGVFFAAFTFYFAGMTAGVVSVARIYIDRRDRFVTLWHRLPLVFAGWALLYGWWVPIAVRAVRYHPSFAPDVLDWPWWRYRLHAFAAGDITDSTLNLGSVAFWCAVATGIVLSRKAQLLRMAVVWLVGCGAIEIIALHYRPHYSAARHLMPAWIGAMILAGAGVAIMFRRRWSAPIAAALALAFTIYSGMALARYFRGGRPDWRGVAEFVHARMRPGDTLIAANEWAGRNMGYYWERLPPVPNTRAQQYVVSPQTIAGPVWIVSGQCTPRAPMLSAQLVKRFPETDAAELRYVPRGQSLPMDQPLCPE